MTHLLDAAVLLLVVALAHAGWQRGLGALAVLAGTFIVSATITGGLAWAVFGERRAGPTAVAGGMVVVFVVHTNFVQVRTLLRRARPGPDPATMPTRRGRVLLAWRELRDKPLQRDRRDHIDRAMGAGAYVVLACALGWWGTSVAAVSPLTEPLAGRVIASLTYRGLHRMVAADGATAGALVRTGVLPGLPEPEIRAAAPDPSLAASPDLHRAARATVEVNAPMCSVDARGSGWVAARDLVLTNAHVVAGSRRATVRAVLARTGADGLPIRPVQFARKDATVVLFDPVDDVAVLRVPGIGGGAPTSPAPLPIAQAVPNGEDAVIAASAIGPPWHLLVPARVDRTIPYTLLDLFGAQARATHLTVLRAAIEPGYSGSPVLDRSGDVAAMIVARDTRQHHTGGYAVPARILQSRINAARHRHHATSTGPCTPDVR